MALSGTSTLADAKAQYLDNLGWKTEGSAVKCKAFMEACEALLLLLPKKTSRGSQGMQVEMDPTLIAKRLEAATNWLAQNGSTGGAVRHASFENFR